MESLLCLAQNAQPDFSWFSYANVSWVHFSSRFIVLCYNFFEAAPMQWYLLIWASIVCVYCVIRAYCCADENVRKLLILCLMLCVTTTQCAEQQSSPLSTDVPRPQSPWSRPRPSSPSHKYDGTEQRWTRQTPAQCSARTVPRGLYHITN